MNDLEKIVDSADMIINGYAFSKCELGYRVLNLHNQRKAMVITTAGEPIETTMDDIEMSIVKDYYLKNKKFLED